MLNDQYIKTLDLNEVPAPDFIENISYEAIRAEALAKLAELMPDYVALESDPVIKLIEAFSYREFLVRQRINDAASANNIVSAKGHDLDVMGAFVGIKRLEGEEDSRFRKRVQQGLSSLSTAGSRNGYIFHTLSVDTAILDANVYSPSPGAVVVSVLAFEELLAKDASEAERKIGQALFAQPRDKNRVRILCRKDHALIAKVRERLNSDEVRPLTDALTVVAATPKPYDITAKITIYPGPDRRVVEELSRQSLQRYLKRVQKLGYSVTRSGLIAALANESVQNISLLSPTNDQLAQSFEVLVAQNIDISIEDVHV